MIDLIQHEACRQGFLLPPGSCRGSMNGSPHNPGPSGPRGTGFPSTGGGPCVALLAAVLFAGCDAGRAGTDPPPGGYEIAVEHVTRIGEESGEGILGGGIFTMASFPDGRFSVWDMQRPGIVRLFGPDGWYQATLCSFGYGPGEFRMPTWHWSDPTGDSIFVLDVELGRLSVFSADGAELLDIRIYGVGNPLSVTPLRDGRVVANSVGLSPEGVGLPMVVLDRSGAVEQALGTEFPVHVGTGMFAPHRGYAGEDPEGTVWVSPVYEPRLEKWRPGAAPSDPWVLEASYDLPGLDMPPVSDRGPNPRSPDDPPRPHSVWGVSRTDGPVWLIVRVPHPDWRDRLHEGGVRAVHTMTPETTNQVSLVMAVHPETGEVLARQRLDVILSPFIGEDMAFSPALTDTGSAALDVWRLRLEPAMDGR